MENKLSLYWVLLSLTLFMVQANILKYSDKTSEIIRDSANVTKDWDHLEDVLKKLAYQGTKKLLPVIMNVGESLNISLPCLRDSMKVFVGIQKLEAWAIKFLDSSAKIIDGLLTGTTTNFGSYDECINNVVIKQDSVKQKEKVMFSGKYCTLSIKPHLPPVRYFKLGEIIEELKDIYNRKSILSGLAKNAPALYAISIRLGICVPSSCTTNDLNQMFVKVADYTRLYMKVKTCEVKEDPKYTPVMIFVISLYSFVGFLVLLGTAVDVYFYYSKTKACGTFIHFVLTFSARASFRKLIDTSKCSESTGCLHGIRFLTMSWEIIGHSHVFLLVYEVMSSADHTVSKAKELAFQVIANGYVSVETFFYLGGFVLSYVSTRQVVVEKKPFSLKLYIFHRLWRILPTYVFVTMFMFIAELLSSGPEAHRAIYPYLESCKDNWWTNFLFINNFYHADDICLPHSWYLSADMQLYISSLIIILLLFRWPKIGISLAIAILVGSAVASGIITWTENLPPTYLFESRNLELLWSVTKDILFVPFPHVGSYVIGILSGYLVAVRPDLRIPRLVQIIGWCCAIASSTSAMYGVYEWNRGKQPEFWETIFYASLHRTAWSLGVAWMVVCCTTGQGGVINYILSWKPWIILGRLTYATYLIHVYVILCFIAALRKTVDSSNAILVWIYISNVAVSYGVSFVVNMLIELPFMSIEKILLPQSDKTAEKAESDGGHVLPFTEEAVKENPQQNSLNGQELCAIKTDGASITNL